MDGLPIAEESHVEAARRGPGQGTSAMLDLELIARMEQQYRESALYPELARKEGHLRELERLDGQHGAGRRGGARRLLGNGLVGVGDLLVALGERIAPRSRGVSAR